MSYGTHHPTVLPPRFRGNQGRGFRTPSAVERWAVAEIASHLISGLVALIFFAISAGGLLAVAAAIGPVDRGRPISLLPGLIGGVSMCVLDVIYRGTRNRTRPSPLPPLFELHSGRSEPHSGRSSPLYDRDLDGGIWS